MQYTLITDHSALVDFCRQAQQQPAIAVDTEFVRTRTLYPKLGLIQIYDGQNLVLIDPLSISDMKPLVDLMTDANVVKVMHSCSEDLETFWHSLQIIPAPIFDTQFAACLLDMGATLGYANLVETMLGVTLDKGESRTDWIARPLSDKQCEYAANDVLYLFQLYPTLRDKVTEAGRLPWVYEEIQQLGLKKTSTLPADLAYLTIKNNWKLTGRALYLLKQLAKWRLEEARHRDLAVNFVIRESNLVEIARLQPSHKGALFSIEGLSAHEARIHGDTIIGMVRDAQDAPEECFPPKIERLIEMSAFKKVSSAIRAICQRQADELAIPVEVIGSKKQIQQLLKSRWFDVDENRAMGLEPDLMIGWRGQLVGEEINKLLAQRG